MSAPGTTRRGTLDHSHPTEEVCQAGLELYARVLNEGPLPADAAEGLPCVLDHGLLRPSLVRPGHLCAAAPAVALQDMLLTSATRIAEERRREARLARAFEPLLRAAADLTGASGETPGIRVHGGLDRINSAISLAMGNASRELLAVQPHTGRDHAAGLARSLERDQALLDRGGRIRTLYQHTQRHSPFVTARYEQLTGDAEARTLDQVTERLIVIDRAAAFIPANKDRTLALEIRLPALVDYLVTVFDRLWHLATPLYPQAAAQPTLNGITARQRAIAALLVEGHTDAVIADRLGMNIRTARLHIAKLAATLGSESRAQLGYLIARAGILDQEP